MNLFQALQILDKIYYSENSHLVHAYLIKNIIAVVPKRYFKNYPVLGYIAQAALDGYPPADMSKAMKSMARIMINYIKEKLLLNTAAYAYNEEVSYYLEHEIENTLSQATKSMVVKDDFFSYDKIGRYLDNPKPIYNFIDKAIKKMEQDQLKTDIKQDIIKGYFDDLEIIKDYFK